MSHTWRQRLTPFILLWSTQPFFVCNLLLAFSDGESAHTMAAVGIVSCLDAVRQLTPCEPHGNLWKTDRICRWRTCKKTSSDKRKNFSPPAASRPQPHCVRSLFNFAFCLYLFTDCQIGIGCALPIMEHDTQQICSFGFGHEKSGLFYTKIQLITTALTYSFENAKL